MLFRSQWRGAQEGGQWIVGWTSIVGLSADRTLARFSPPRSLGARVSASQPRTGDPTSPSSRTHHRQQPFLHLHPYLRFRTLFSNICGPHLVQRRRSQRHRYPLPSRASRNSALTLSASPVSALVHRKVEQRAANLTESESRGAVPPAGDSAPHPPKASA